MTENDIYIIAKAWIEKDHESNAVDYIKLMAADLYRRIDFHTQQKAEAQQPEFTSGQTVKCLFGNSGNKFWADRLKPFVTISEIKDNTGTGKPNELKFKEIPETWFYSNDFNLYEPESLLTDKVEEAARNLAFKIIDGSETIDKTTKRIIEFHSQFSQPTESDKLLSEARNIIHALSIMGKNQGWNNPASGKQTLIKEMDLFLTKTANHK